MISNNTLKKKLILFTITAVLILNVLLFLPGSMAEDSDSRCDNIPPVTTKDHEGDCLFYDQTENLWYMQPCTTIYLSARDEHQWARGVRLIHYEIWEDVDCDGCYDILIDDVTIYDDGDLDLNKNPGEMDIEFQICDEGCFKLLYYARDKGCNKEPTHYQYYRLTDCQDEVWIDNSFNSDTPGWWIDHFKYKQIALDWLDTGGTAYVNPGIYDEDISIDDIPCCDNTGITQMGSYGCFPIGESAIIRGTETIKVDDVTIKYLEYSPTSNAAIIIQNRLSGITLRCNKFQQDCLTDTIGVNSFTKEMVDAELNWWGRPSGPQGGIMDDGAVADGMGVKVFGNVDVEPWIGIHAEITEPVWSMSTDSMIEVKVGEPVMFDASESWAYTYGECCQQPKRLHMQYLWDFGDGHFSSNRVTAHVFEEPGVYEVSLMVDSHGIPGLYANFMYDWATVTVIVSHVEEEPLTLQINDGESDRFQTMTNEPFLFSASVAGGTPPYEYEWVFDDLTRSALPTPTHIFDSAGKYIVSLTVVDAKDVSISDSVLIEVVEYHKDDPDDENEDDDIEISDIQAGLVLSAKVFSDSKVQWSIDVEGAIFFGGHADGLIEKTYGFKYIYLLYCFGIGSVDITVTVGSEIKQYKATLFGTLFINIQEK